MADPVVPAPPPPPAPPVPPRDPVDQELELDRESGRRPTSVAYSRFADVVQQRNQAREQAATLEAERKAFVAERAAERAELEALRKERAAWAEERAMVSAGLTDEEGQEVARTLHRRLPEKDRPALGDWLQALRKEPAKAPKSLQPFFTTEGQGQATAQGQAPAQGQGLGSTRTGQRADAPTTGAKWTGEQIRAARAEAVRTGDWSKVQAAMKAGQI